MTAIPYFALIASALALLLAYYFAKTVMKADEVMLMALGDARMEKLWTGQQTVLQVGVGWGRNQEAAKRKTMNVLVERVIEFNP